MWWQLLAIGVGIVVTAAPDVFALSNRLADAFHVLGPVIVAFGAISMSAVLRSLRRIQLLLGPATAAAPVLTGGEVLGVVVGVSAGVVLVALAFAGGTSLERHGGGWKRLFQ